MAGGRKKNSLIVRLFLVWLKLLQQALKNHRPAGQKR
jgi:hypothetical protein